MKANKSKVKISRQLGIAVTPKAARFMEKRPYPPGQHGPTKRKGKMSEYKQQLVEKQKLRAQYNISERQMSNCYKKASGKTGSTEENIIQALETRLDAIVLRSGMVKTIYAARQFVSHGHIQVNGRRVDIPSFQVKIGDVVSVKEKSRKIPCFDEFTKQDDTPEVPKYLELDQKGLSIKLAYVPERKEIPVICELSSVVEYYSR